ncbi:MAG: ComEA family DNA-binding protein [Candidatus Nanopelagicales bacterium]
MRRTQDIVLARLRLYSMRWRSPLGGDPQAREGTAPARPGPEVWLRLVGLLAALAVAGASTVLWVALPRSDTAPPLPSASPLLVAEPLVAPSSAPSLIVHVAGDVRRPGVVELPAGARVGDAVKAAGGLQRGAKLGATNLARLVVDGERVEVGSGSDAGSAGGALAATAAPAAAAGPVDLNAATAEQLDALPGVGPVTAARILAWRAEHGRFTVVDELAEVAGIGPKTLAELRSHVRV